MAKAETNRQMKEGKNPSLYKNFVYSRVFLTTQ